MNAGPSLPDSHSHGTPESHFTYLLDSGKFSYVKVSGGDISAQSDGLSFCQDVPDIGICGQRSQRRCYVAFYFQSVKCSVGIPVERESSPWSELGQIYGRAWSETPYEGSELVCGERQVVKSEIQQHAARAREPGKSSVNGP